MSGMVASKKLWLWSRFKIPHQITISLSIYDITSRYLPWYRYVIRFQSMFKVWLWSTNYLLRVIWYTMTYLWKITINQRQINYKWAVIHSYVRLPKGRRSHLRMHLGRWTKSHPLYKVVPWCPSSYVCWFINHSEQFDISTIAVNSS